MFEKVSDEKLLRDCKAQVLVEKNATSKVLEYLSEIDKRRLWVEGYSSLFDFCVRYLGYSEGETNRRIQAARLISRVETVKPLLEEGAISLTNLSFLSSVLTLENAPELLPQVINQPSRKVEEIVQRYLPVEKRKAGVFKVEIDGELKELLSQAKLVASENNHLVLLKRVLRSFIREKRPRAAQVKKHTRSVPKALSREVIKNAQHQCEYISPQGVRCTQQYHLQIDHIRPWKV